MAAAFLAGALLTGSLIVAIGPQNLHVLRTGIARRHVGATVALCIAADLLLIVLALGGTGHALRARPALALVLQGAGALLLAAMALQAARDALRPAARDGDRTLPAASLSASCGRTLAVTFANPAVWVETLLVVGAAGATWPAAERPGFAAGAVSASALWFTGLGFGARRAARWLARPAVHRALAAASAVAMATMAVVLAEASLRAAPAGELAARVLPLAG